MNDFLTEKGIELQKNEQLILVKLFKKYNLTSRQFYHEFSETYHTFPEYLVITNQRLLLTAESIPWESVYEVRVALDCLFIHISKPLTENQTVESPSISKDCIILKDNKPFFSAILNAWLKNGPEFKMDTFNKELISKYQLDKVGGNMDTSFYSGRGKGHSFNYTCRNNLPFTKVSLSLFFDQPPERSLGIGSEQLFPEFIKWVGYKNITTPDSMFNEYFQVKSNQPDAMTEFLTKDRRRLFNMLSVIGKCSWNYKPPTKLFKRKTLTENESILDDSDLISEIGAQLEQKKVNSLVATGIIKEEYAFDYAKIQQFIHQIFEVTMLLKTDFLNR